PACHTPAFRTAPEPARVRRSAPWPASASGAHPFRRPPRDRPPAPAGAAARRRAGRGPLRRRETTPACWSRPFRVAFGRSTVMPTPAQRTTIPEQTRTFGRYGDTVEVPPLTDIQTESYKRFLQLDVPPEQREPIGLEGVLREIFPIDSYDKSLKLEYIKYELGKPRYDPDECRQLRLTYGRPFRVWLRLNMEQPITAEVYLGDMPIMIGGGEFIINGAERVVVSQLHRSPGVDFVVETEAGERKLHSCRIIPERGSWIEINVTKKDTLSVRIDQSGKFSAI